MDTHTKVKIVATIGPKTGSQEMLERLIAAGMNVMRLNMSHGDHAEHQARIGAGRAAAEKLGVPVAILQDLSGPKIRTGIFKTERITLKEGELVTLTTREVQGDEHLIYINYQKLPQEVNVGSAIMIDDGRKKVVVESVEGQEIHCRVEIGGELKPRRGVNIPGAHLSIDTITPKDKEDLAFGIAAGVDMVALSFVRRPEDVLELKELLAQHGKPSIPVISKIETQEAIENLHAILEVSDGAMVARGDLAIEIPTEDVPRWQKEMIRIANELGKPIITATQMLESMIHSPVPTRAEVSDVANAVYDGTDALMLSEESTLGEYPVEAVATLTRIARACEGGPQPEAIVSIQDSVTAAVARASEQLGAKVIVALTESGHTARLVARFHPAAPIVALTPRDDTRKVLALSRCVYPYKIAPLSTLDEALAFIPGFLKEHGFAKDGDTVIVTAGLKFGVAGSTNTLVAIQM